MTLVYVHVLQAGGNSIAFAKTCGFVLACEIDSARIQTAKANAGVYGERRFNLRISFFPVDTDPKRRVFVYFM